MIVFHILFFYLFCFVEILGATFNPSKKEDERKHKLYTHNPYNGVVCNDIILATGVFSSKELWKLSKGIQITPSLFCLLNECSVFDRIDSARLWRLYSATGCRSAEQQQCDQNGDAQHVLLSECRSSGTTDRRDDRGQRI